MTPSPLKNLQERYGELLQLCDSVEAIIDSVAGRIDPDLCLATAAKISKPGGPVAAPPHSRTTSPDPQPLLAATLQSAVAGRSVHSWSAVDAMLRVFLDELRRHVAAEQVLLQAMEGAKAAH
ncbi:hypothetical protein [Sinorhizobium alkalisoli]|uniref:Uncharacterized protein n=1 Tax=Sinorhizobium alkalisoli TaxID=1752398 RepID=A0A1E3VGZ7_9HYPH|nr:hypothetical protein [Sinorhizobium alkalisoli]ODR92862.1 hypothetical protein A8M32_02860 [Sinorhizobium alkalisoli]QFI70385.1 hypothetical protein EKH55_5511 [Sinorhizobium alkalisoli]